MKLVIAGLLAFFAGSVSADTTRVLFIGNSYIYSNDLPAMVRQLALSNGDTVETGMSAPGGHTLQQHCLNTTTQALIAQGDWDFVVVQEQSQLPSFSPQQVAVDVLPYAVQLAQQVRQANPCTEVVFMMTWGRENGDAANCVNYPPVCTYGGMQQRLRESYLLMAEQNSAWCVPVGSVWRMYRESNPGTGLYTDGSHPNMRGSFIAASTLVSSLFRTSTTSATYVPNGLEAADALYIRGLASAMVLDSLSTWNIGINDPEAEFDWNQLEGGSILFANNTPGAVSQTWHFGDGGSSTEFDPLHTYDAPGNYVVELITRDACGRMDTAMAELIILISSIAQVEDHEQVTLHFDRAASWLVLDGTHNGGLLELWDASGRTIHWEIVPTGNFTMIRPTGAQGVILWRFTADKYGRSAGRLLLP